MEESRKTAAAATTLHKTSTVQQKVGTKVPPLDEIKDNEDVFLVLPSYAEPFSQKIRQIIFAEKQKCALGFHLSALGGLYCDHGNKLMWGNYSSRTGTFFCIQLYSRNVNHIYWV